MLKGSVVYLAASEGALNHKVVLETIRLNDCSIIGDIGLVRSYIATNKHD
jgi:hypothetical protein